MNPKLLKKEPLSLDLNMSDYVAFVAKSILGVAPFAGSLLVEIAGTIIPNQRMDRIVKFAVHLEQKLSKTEQSLARSQLTDENFTDLLEESIRQAAKTVAEERRAYIAQLIANSISADSVSFIESKHFLRILGEINDVEVLWLRHYLDTRYNVASDTDADFHKRHADVFDMSRKALGSAAKVRYKHAMKDSYLQHLSNLGLLSASYQAEGYTDKPTFDRFKGEFKLSGYHLTSVGRLLLRHVGLMPWEQLSSD